MVIPEEIPLDLVVYQLKIAMRDLYTSLRRKFPRDDISPVGLLGPIPGLVFSRDEVPAWILQKTSVEKETPRMVAPNAEEEATPRTTAEDNVTPQASPTTAEEPVVDIPRAPLRAMFGVESSKPHPLWWTELPHADQEAERADTTQPVEHHAGAASQEEKREMWRRRYPGHVYRPADHPGPWSPMEFRLRRRRDTGQLPEDESREESKALWAALSRAEQAVYREMTRREKGLVVARRKNN